MTASPDIHPICFVNGQLQNSAAVTDRGMAYGDGLFETVRFKQSCLPAWPLHLQRLLRGAEILQLKVDAPEVERYLRQALDNAEEKGVTDGVLKLIVTRGSGGAGYLPPVDQQPTFVVIIRSYHPLALPAGSGTAEPAMLELRDCAYRLSHNRSLAGLKHLNRLEQVLAAQSVELTAGQQGLVFDVNDRVIEALHHNLFLVKSGRLLTPDLSLCGVAGVMRRAIMEQFAPSVGAAIHIGHIYDADLEAADEVFICNAVHGITPVWRWRDRVWQEGPVTRQLRQCISRQWTNFYDR